MMGRGFYRGDKRHKVVDNDPTRKSVVRGKTNDAFDAAVNSMRMTLPERTPSRDGTALNSFKVDVGNKKPRTNKATVAK
jgi:hypothetical protein